MAAVAKEEIERIIEATDMYALVSPYVTLQKSGSGYKGLCPFHQEKTPSFSVSQEKHLAHCFSCGKGGSPIQFLMDIKHIPFLEAVKELADFNHIKINLADQNTKLELEKQKFYNMNDLTNKLFIRNLNSTNSGEKALAYLIKRGLDKETIDTFSLGLAPKENNIIYNLLKQSNYLELDVVEAGLVRNNDGNYVDFFVNRIMFPIKDERGRIIGFSGRDYNNTSQAKYLNSIETPVFKKNLVLYNLNLALNYISQNDRVILHEGYMDVIASFRSGLKEVVCSMGTELTQGQIRKIARLTKNVILCYDSDSAGIKATLRAGTLLIKEGLNVSTVKLDKTKDSDEYVLKYGLSAYYNYFTTHIKSFLDYVFSELFTDIDITNIILVEEKKKEFFKYLRLYNSNLIVDKYLSLLAEKIKVNIATLQNDYYAKEDILIPSPYEIRVNVKKPSFDKLKVYEIRIFDYAKSSKSYALKIDAFLESDNNFIGINNKCQILWQNLINYYSDKEEFSEEEFVSFLKQQNLYDDYYNLIKAGEKYQKINIPYSEEDLEACLKKINKIAGRKKLNNIQTSINSQSDATLKKELTEQKFAMRQKYERK